MLPSHKKLHAHVNGKRVHERDGVRCSVLVGRDLPQYSPFKRFIAVSIGFDNMNVFKCVATLFVGSTRSQPLLLHKDGDLISYIQGIWDKRGRGHGTSCQSQGTFQWMTKGRSSRGLLWCSQSEGETIRFLCPAVAWTYLKRCLREPSIQRPPCSPNRRANL